MLGPISCSRRPGRNCPTTSARSVIMSRICLRPGSMRRWKSLVAELCGVKRIPVKRNLKIQKYGYWTALDMARIYFMAALTGARLEIFSDWEHALIALRDLNRLLLMCCSIYGLGEVLCTPICDFWFYFLVSVLWISKSLQRGHQITMGGKPCTCSGKKCIPMIEWLETTETASLSDRWLFPIHLVGATA